MKYELAELPYSYDSLEPYIDEQTMRIHHDKHHQAYIEKLNAALEKFPELQTKTAEELLENLSKIPKSIRKKLVNFGGGHVNHSFFWSILKKDIPLQGEIVAAIDKKFGSFQDFRQKFTEKAMSLFGSGWVWLVLNKGQLEILSSANQDSPISDGKKPLLVIDLWEHAYYLKYQNRRADWINSFFRIINWQKVNELFLAK